MGRISAARLRGTPRTLGYCLKAHPKGYLRGKRETTSKDRAHCPQAECTKPPPFPRYPPALQHIPMPAVRQAAHIQLNTSKRHNILTSGATYGKLPHLPLNNLVFPLCLNTAHSPKSEIFRLPFAASSRFSGLRSRCAIPFEWTNSCLPLLSLPSYFNRREKLTIPATI